MSERNFDAEFDDIISRLGPPPPPEAEATPSLPTDQHRPKPIRSVHDITAALPTDSTSQPPPQPQVWRESPPIAEADEHFEPPPVRLPPPEDVGYWATFAGLVGGPLIVLMTLILRPSYTGWWAALGITVFVGGFFLLVLRQPRSRDGDDIDGGARV